MAREVVNIRFEIGVYHSYQEFLDEYGELKSRFIEGEFKDHPQVKRLTDIRNQLNEQISFLKATLRNPNKTT